MLGTKRDTPGGRRKNRGCPAQYTGRMYKMCSAKFVVPLHIVLYTQITKCYLARNITISLLTRTLMEELPPDESPYEQFVEPLRRALVARRTPANTNIVNLFSRKQVEQHFLEAFELVGGISRLALWAADEKNYGKFLEMYVKLAPKQEQEEQKGQVFEYRSNVPASPLNRPPPVIEDATYREVSGE